jgi:hypothetical protein
MKLITVISHDKMKQNIAVSDLKGSYGWVRYSTPRHNLTIRHPMMTAQRLLKAYKEKLVSFQKYILKLRKQQYLLGRTWNSDKIPLFFDIHNH